MGRLLPGDVATLLRFVRALHSTAPPELEAGIVADLGGVVPADSISFNEIDLGTPSTRAVIHPPDAGDIPAYLGVFQRHIHEHPVLRHYQATGDTSALAISDLASARQLERLGLYREFYRPRGVRDQLAIGLRLAGRTVVGVACNRSRRGFRQEERLKLELVAPHIREAWHAARAVERAREGPGARSGLVAAEVVGLPPRGAAAVGARAARWLAEYFGPGRHRECLPAAVAAWAASGARELLDGVPEPRRPLVVERGDRRLVVRLGRDGDLTLLILEERRERVAPEDLLALGLTRRESEILAWVAEGKTNAEVAAIVGTRPRTVAKHLERVFRKLGVETRTAAAMVARQAVAAGPTAG
jgi:DNA-binding CsgD family transcriptional regulator